MAYAVKAMLTPLQQVPVYAKMANTWRVATDEQPNTGAAFPANSLKALRERAGMSQPDLARRSGVSQQQISKLENSRIELKAYQLRRLAGALGCTADDTMAAPGDADATGGPGSEPFIDQVSHDFRLEVAELLRERQISDRDDRLGFLEDVRRLFLEYRAGQRRPAEAKKKLA